MITLPPFPPRPAWLSGFCTALSLLVGVLTGVLFTATLGWLWLAVAPVIAAGMIALGWIWPGLVVFSYRAWNKLAREFARFARFWILTVCYHVILKSVARSASFFRVAAPKPGESFWVERRSPRVQAVLQPLSDADLSSHHWVTAYLSWCATPRNIWAVWLMPFLFLLSLVETEERKDSVPSDIYTLY